MHPDGRKRCSGKGVGRGRSGGGGVGGDEGVRGESGLCDKDGSKFGKPKHRTTLSVCFFFFVVVFD